MMEDKKLGRLLVKEGLLSEEELAKALAQQGESYNKSLTETLIGLKLADEAGILRVLAKTLHTKYLTTQKLSEIKISEAIKQLVPQTTAEKYTLFPVQYKGTEKSLIIAMADPLNVAAIDEVKFVSGIANIKTLIAPQAAILSAIAMWYKGEKNAFHSGGISVESYEEQSEFGSYEGSYGESSAVKGVESDDSPLDLSALVAEAQGVKKAKGKTAQAEKSQEDDSDITLAPMNDEEEVYLGGMDSMPGDDNLSRSKEEESRASAAEGNAEEAVEEEESEEDAVEDESAEEVEEVEISKPAEKKSERIAKHPDAEFSTERAPVAGGRDGRIRRPDKKKYRQRMLVVEDHDAIRRYLVKLYKYEGFKVEGFEKKERALDELRKGEYDSFVIKEKYLEDSKDFERNFAKDFPDVELCIIKDYGSAVIGETKAYQRLMSAFLETLDTLAGLVEMDSDHFQGHSHNVSKYARLIAAKLDLTQKEVDTINLAAALHDLGKKGMQHFTILQVGATTEKEAIMEQAEIPLKMLSSANLPLKIGPIIRQQYERWDGRGIPDGLKGEQIPLGSRILALADCFEDLTNKYSGREAVDPSAALELLNRQAGKLFDPDLLGILIGVVRDDIYLQRMEGARDSILIADSERDLTTMMELRLVNMDYRVIIARDGEDALAKAKAEKPSLVITEMDLPKKDGMEWISEMLKSEEAKDIPFVFLSRKDDTESVTQGLNLGAEDYITKPVKVDVLGAKINKMMARLRADKKDHEPRAKGVSGSLSEMSLPDIIQILGAGRKTGMVLLTNNNQSAEIYLEEGRIVNAKVEDLKGEEAFYKILYWIEGSFSIDPSKTTEERLIDMNNDSLMLEGFRRMDEEAHDKGSGDDITMDGTDFF